MENVGAPGDSLWLDRVHGVGSDHLKRYVGLVVLDQYISFIISRHSLRRSRLRLDVWFYLLPSRMRRLLSMNKEFNEFFTR